MQTARGEAPAPSPTAGAEDRETERLTLLVEASRELLGSVDEPSALAAVLDLAQRMVEADAYALWLLDRETQQWRLELSAGLSEEYRHAAAEAILGSTAVVSLEEPLAVEDLDSTEWLTPAHRAAHRAEGNRSMLAVALHMPDRVAGTLVFYYRRPHRFSPAETRSATALANLAAAAIGHAELYSAQARMAEERRFLAEAGELLASSLDYETTLANVARLAVPRFADWCTIDMLEPDGSIGRLAVAHVDPTKVRWANELAERHPPRPNAKYGVPKVIRTGQPEVLTEIPDELLIRAAREDPESLEILRELGLRSSMCVPLVSPRHGPLGAITFVSAESGRRYTDSDLALASDLARRAAVAVEKALVYRDVDEQRRLAEESRALLDTLLATAPVGLAFLDRELRYVHVNEALAAINGLPAEDHVGRRLPEVLPAFPELEELHRRVLETGEPLLNVELTGPQPTRPSETGHWLASYYAVRGEDEQPIGIGVVVVDRTDAKRAGDEQRFLAAATEVLGESLDYERTLDAVAHLVVPGLAGQCIVDLVNDDGSTRAVAIAHVDPAKERLLRELRDRYPPTAAGHPVRRVLATRRAELLPELDDATLDAMAQDEEHAALIRQLGNRSGIVAPLVARGRTIGALWLGTVDPSPPFGPSDLRLAEELARRAAAAVDNALLYRQAEERAQAASALAFVGDGVFLVDHDGHVALWNPMAATITGLDESDVVGHAVADVLPGWRELAARVPVASSRASSSLRAETVPFELAGRELWLSILGVSSPHGTVYAFRDVTDERRVERLKSDFVATVSHELRTPLAAVYGGAQTLLREDVVFDDEARRTFLELIADEAERLARIVEEVLLASQLEGGEVRFATEGVDAVDLARRVVEAAAPAVPGNVRLTFEANGAVDRVAGDGDKIRQVLANLVDNAIKYSPGGGEVRVEVTGGDGRVRFSVHDRGLGIPPGAEERIFDKFYRLDPNLTRGVGGTGLGLYISRELVRRMDGRIWVESADGRGSIFTFELPAA